MSSLVLIGPRGAGKTSAGRATAARLGWDFVDTDALIETRGRTIAEIFAAEGEPGFRRLERSIIAELWPARDTVIATGGGVVLDPDNRRRLSALGPVVYLIADAEQLVARIAGSDRPALTDADPLTEMRQVLIARDPLYRGTARTVLDTGALSLDDVVDQLVARVQTAAQKEQP